MKSFAQNKEIKEICKLKFVNFQLSILQFSKQKALKSFDNLFIGNYLKIGNWKLKIRELMNTMIAERRERVCESSLI